MYTFLYTLIPSMSRESTPESLPKKITNLILIWHAIELREKTYSCKGCLGNSAGRAVTLPGHRPKIWRDGCHRGGLQPPPAPTPREGDIKVKCTTGAIDSALIDLPQLVRGQWTNGVYLIPAETQFFTYHSVPWRFYVEISL